MGVEANAFITADEAYLACLAAVVDGEHVASVTDPDSKASNFGLGDRPAVERRNHQFTLTDPRDCEVTIAESAVNVPYAIGLVAWSLRGDNDVAALAFYRPSARDFSDDGYTLCGAFGHRLLVGRSAQGDQIEAVLDLLRRDPSSRRTYCAVIEPRDNFVRSREYPCSAGLQFFLRAGALHMTTYMRAQQALTVLPYDLFVFCSVQLYAAASLEVNVGTYTHFSGTIHIYEDELHRTRNLLANPTLGHRRRLLPSTREGFRELMLAEVECRRIAARGSVAELQRLVDGARPECRAALSEIVSYCQTLMSV